MVTYQHNRVVFGITSSPFLLGASINHHLDASRSQSGAIELMGSFYVDNLVMSVNSLKQYYELQENATKIMGQAKMELRQWACTKQTGTREESSEKDELLPILGLIWNRTEDSLSCNVKNVVDTDTDKVTKRVMLSIVSQVYDPMGYLAPAMLIPKGMIQEVWKNQCGWDTPVSAEVGKKFQKWTIELKLLESLKILRWNQVYNAKKRQVFVFCDSSKNAMAAVAYLRTEDEVDTKLQFLMCKSRLTPIKKITIPRLELVSCVIGIRMAQTVVEALGLSMTDCVFWSDSSTALTWIRRAGDRGVFVRNRVNEIVAKSNSDQWHHVPGVANPADLPSRGCTPRTLMQSGWWEGPSWLLDSPFPRYTEQINEDEVETELKKTVTAMVNVTPETPRFSSYRRNIALWGWVCRFINNCRKEHRSSESFLSIGELRVAEKVVLYRIQKDSFLENCQEIGGIHVGRDKEGLLRVKTRLCNRNDKDDFIYPIVLPKIHPLVDLLVADVHRYHGHGGVRFLHCKIREKYWIIQSRRVIRRNIRGCVKCRRHTATHLEVDPAPLPTKRVEDCEVFNTTGVDVAGPLYLKDGKKVWICVFTCAVYRAVYLDLVSSLSTEDFFLALERLIAQCGRPNTIYSDNGTNFVGAANLFHRLDWSSIAEETGARQIQWIFNPPSAAWWGGWWERIVRMVKDLLKRMIGKSRLTYDELRTCLCGVAASINDRPLTMVTEDAMDLVPLTPSMFLRQRIYGHLPDLEKAEGLTKSYRNMKELQKSIQDRFRKEYLGLLVTKGGQNYQMKIAVGDVVLVGTDNKKRFEWPLGLVTELIPGKDEKIRVAKVKTATGSFVRPLQRLFPLEVSAKKENNGVVFNKVPNVKHVFTRSGREVKKPTRYGQWAHLVSSV